MKINCLIRTRKIDPSLMQGSTLSTVIPQKIVTSRIFSVYGHLCCVLAFSVYLILKQASAEPSSPSIESDTNKTKADVEGAILNPLDTRQKSIKITLYPQHDQVELLGSQQIIESWSSFFGEVSDNLSHELSSQVLDNFLMWKRSQDLFTELEVLEGLQTSLADHLFVLSQGEGLDALTHSEREKLQTALNRLNLQKEHLAREEEWREQELLLSTKLNPLKELSRSETALRESLDLAVNEFELEVRKQFNELARFENHEGPDLARDETLSNTEEKDPVDGGSLDEGLGDREHKGYTVLEAAFESEESLDLALENELKAEYLESQKELTHELEVSLSALKLFHESIKTREERLNRCLQSLERLLFDSSSQLQELSSLRDQNQNLLHRVTLWNSYWETREQLHRRHESSSKEGILSQISGQRNPLNERWKALKEVDTDLQSRVDAFKISHIKPLSASQPPKIGEAEKQTPFHRAKHAHDSAKRFLSFHSDRKGKLKETIERGGGLIEEIDGLRKKLKLNWEDFIEHDVLAAKLLREESIKISLFTVSQVIERASERESERRLTEMMMTQERWDRYRDRLTKSIKSWEETLKDDVSSVERIEQELNSEGGLADRLKLESSWLDFIKEIEVLSGEQLLTKHKDALAVYVEQESALKSIKSDYDQVLNRYQKAWSELRELSDPLLRQYRSDSRDFQSQISELLPLVDEELKVEHPQEPHNEVKLSGERSDDAASSSKITDGRQSSEREKTLDSRESTSLETSDRSSLTRRSESGLGDQVNHQNTVNRVAKLSRHLRDLLPPRITYYQQYNQKSEELNELIAQRQALILSLQGEFAKRVEYARQVRRTASVIRQRVLESELPSDVMTEEIESHGQREWVEQLRAESLDDLKRALDYDRHLLSLEPSYLTLKDQIHQWRQLLSDILDLSSRQVRIINEAEEAENTSQSIQNHDNEEQKDKQKTLNERQFEHQLHLRMEKDYPWFDGLWASFTNDDIANLEELLREHYVELLKTEHAQNFIEERITLTQTLFDRVSAQRPILEAYQLALNGITKHISDRFERYKDEFGVRLDHQETLKRLRLKSSSSSAHLDYLQLTTFKSHSERRAGLGELEQLWSMDKVYQSVARELYEQLGPQGLLEELAGEVKDAISQLETERDELNRPLLRLLGSRARGIDLSQELPRIGEIDRLHEERMRMKLRVVFLSLLSFLLIPLITFLCLRTLGSVESRIRKHSERELERLILEGESLTRQKRAEREDRLATLLQVMRTTVKLLIFTVAIGAMLRTLHVDVTPIIASAGIIGLAFAFGAQELVKDFFAGIFILFENQYNRGDFVTINGIFGWIDKITLRITVIRDSHGVIHFIPNGQVQVVSNHNKEWSQAHLEIGASYNNPPKQVIDCLRQLCKEVAADPVIGEDVLEWEVLGLERFDDSAVVYRVHLKTAPKEKWRVARHFRKRVLEVFAEQGIEIPFPQVVVTHASTSALESEQS